MHTPDRQQIMSILHTVKTFCAISKQRENKLNNKANTPIQCGGFRAAMVNILKRGFFFFFFPDRERDQWCSSEVLGTRRRPCASRLSTHVKAPCTEAKVLAVCWGSGDGHCREDASAPSEGVEGDLLSSLYIPTLAYNSLLLLTQVKTTQLLLTLVFTISPLTASCLWTALHLQRKTMTYLVPMDMKHWNVTLPQNRQLSPTEVIVRSQQSFLVVTVSDCCFCCSTFPPLFVPLQWFISLLLAERRGGWSTKIGPPEAQRSCPVTTGTLAVLERQVWGPPGRKVGTACTNRWLCLISPAPPKEFVQLPWSFYGPCGRSLPIQSPEGGSIIIPLSTNTLAKRICALTCKTLPCGLSSKSSACW